MRLRRSRQRMGILFLLGALIVTSSYPISPPRSQKSNDEAARLFDYDRSAAFDVRDESAARDENGVNIRDISYAASAPGRGRLKAYLVRPVGKGSFAGLTFFHWYGEVNSNRNEFLEEASALARQGAVSLLIQGYLPWSEPFTDLKADRRRIIEQTIEVRRAFDLLLAQPGVDPRRVGFVGHDYGAMYGSIVAGVEKRAKAYILVAGMGSFSDWSLKFWPATAAAQGEEVYRRGMDAVDPVRYIARAAPAALLFQFANSDKYISKATATAFFDAGSKPKQVAWYEAEHDLNVEAARRDRRVWLVRQLRLAKPK